MTEVETPAVPDAPWALVGECVAALVPGSGRRRPGRDGRMPAGVVAIAGPAVVTAVRYTDSPVGPFFEMAVLEPARLGLRLGCCVTTSVVSVPAARTGGRLGWGFPRELGAITWSIDGDERVVRWEERGIELRVAAGRRPVPVLVPVRAMQRRGDGPVVVHGHARGLGRLGSAELVVPDDDPLAAMAGHRRGIVVAGMRMVLRPARRPTGLLSTLRAPARAAEPAMSSGAGRGGTVAAACEQRLTSV